MKRNRYVVYLSLCLLLVMNAASYRAAAQEQRAIVLDDIIAWKALSAPVLSEDGAWFAYRLSPIEGDGDVIIRQTKGDKQFKFSIGETPAPAGGGGGVARAVTMPQPLQLSLFRVMPGLLLLSSILRALRLPSFGGSDARSKTESELRT